MSGCYQVMMFAKVSLRLTNDCNKSSSSSRQNKEREDDSLSNFLTVIRFWAAGNDRGESALKCDRTYIKLFLLSSSWHLVLGSKTR